MKGHLVVLLTAFCIACVFTLMCVCRKHVRRAQRHKSTYRRRLKNAYRHRERSKKALRYFNPSPSDFNQTSFDCPVQSMGASNEEGDQGISRSTTTPYPWSILISEPSALNLHQLQIGNTNPAYSGDSHNSAFDCATAPHEISNEVNIDYIGSASNDLCKDNPPPYESIALFDRRQTFSLEPSAQALGMPHQMHIGYSNSVFFTYPHRGHSASSSATLPRDVCNAHISHPYEVDVAETVTHHSTQSPLEQHTSSSSVQTQLREPAKPVAVSGPSTVLPPEHYAESSTISSALSEYQRSSTKVSGQSTLNVDKQNSCRVRKGNEEHDGNSRPIEDPLSEFDYSAIL